MFPVGLEFKDGSCISVVPPCYGFLKQGQWNGGSECESYCECDEDDCNCDESSYDYTYEVSPNLRPKLVLEYQPRAGTEISFGMFGDLREICLGSNYNLGNLSYIWNVGGCIPYLLTDPNSDKKWAALSRDVESSSKISEEEFFTPIPNNVDVWAKKNKLNITALEVLRLIESYVDSDRESCIASRKVDGFDVDVIGVRADAPADRCLFYLMISRSFYQQAEKASTDMLLDCIFLKGINPVAALMVSRLITESTDLVGKKEARWRGNDYDSCILPMSLIVSGAGRWYDEPIAVDWRQDPYSDSSSDGHLRDEDFRSLTYGNLRVNNSMFLPVLIPYFDDKKSSIIKADDNSETFPAAVTFCNLIANNKETQLNLTCGEYRGDRSRPPSINMYSLYSNLADRQYPSHNPSYDVKPKTEWVDLAIKAVMEG